MRNARTIAAAGVRIRASLIRTPEDEERRNERRGARLVALKPPFSDPKPFPRTLWVDTHQAHRDATQDPVR